MSGDARNEQVSFANGEYRFSGTQKFPCTDGKGGTVPGTVTRNDYTAVFHVTAATERGGILVATMFEGTFDVVNTLERGDCRPHSTLHATFVGVPA